MSDLVGNHIVGFPTRRLKCCLLYYFIQKSHYKCVRLANWSNPTTLAEKYLEVPQSGPIFFRWAEHDIAYTLHPFKTSHQQVIWRGDHCLKSHLKDWRSLESSPHTYPGYKTFFMLSSAETKIYPAHKC